MKSILRACVLMLSPIIVVACTVYALSQPVGAAINPQINFQGKLTNTDGTNVTNGTYSIVFSIYTVASGGAAVWTETQSSVGITDGIFRVALGSITSLPGSVDFNGASLFLGINVNGNGEMTPRVQFTASPYAFNSDKLGGVSSTGFVQLGPAAVQADASTNSSIFVNKTAAGNLIQLQSSAVDIFVLSATGDITLNQASSLTLGVGQRLTNAAGSSLTINAGQGGAGAGANAGGALAVQGGAGGGTNGPGGNITIAAGAGSGSGVVGAVIVRNPSDSTVGFQIQNASSTPLFIIDSTNNRIQVGDTAADAVGTLLVLDTKNTAGDPTGLNGGLYYNSTTGKVRCQESGYWQDCGPSTTRTTYYYTNELMAITTDSTISSQVAGAGAATSVAAVTGEPGRPGVVQFQTGTTATGRAGLLGINASTLVLGNNTEWVYETGVRLPALSSGTQTFTLRAGFLDLATGDPIDGCFVRYTNGVNGGRWQGVCRNNSVESVCDTTIAAVAATWVRLGVVVNAAGTSADFQTNGVSRCQVAANIPITTARATSFGTTMVKTVGTTTSLADVDYIESTARFSASR